LQQQRPSLVVLQNSPYAIEAHLNQKPQCESKARPNQLNGQDAFLPFFPASTAC